MNARSPRNLFWLVLLASCGGGGAAPDQPDAARDAAETLADIQSDVGDAPFDHAADRWEAVDGWSDSGADGVGDTPIEAGPMCPGGTGCPCEQNQDCFTGICVETAEGPVCASPCENEGDCPPWWLCLPVETDAPGAQKGCRDPYSRLCRPCDEDQDCDASVSGQQYACLDRGPDGSFCAVSCQGLEKSQGECPPGYVCEGDGRGASPAWCVPQDGADCPCTEGFVEAGYTTTCYSANEAGTCVSKRTCDQECPAPEPKAESCNGEDDDCDGETDEGLTDNPCEIKNEFGVCKGHTLCDQGQASCEGTPPAVEDCNGLDDDCDGETDEGFLDLDGDSVADCVDPDMDGDGVVNQDDNCPTVVNENQADCNGDGTGDACDDDDDNDGVPDDGDNCWCVTNADQSDTDGDGIGDACDCDMDDDGVASPSAGCPEPDPADNCPLVVNPGQGDNDGDGLGDACDADDDNDQVPDTEDKCPWVADPGQDDMDGDGLGDACDCDMDGDGVDNANAGCPPPNPADNCPGTPNADQADLNTNGIGDACEDDWDADGVANSEDVCPWVPDPGQADLDGDGSGDACDCDADGDKVDNANPGCPEPDPADNCAFDINPGQEDLDGDGKGDQCDPDRDGDGDPNVTDCAPDDPDIFNGRDESCNGKDDDCDGETDEQDALGCAAFYRDGDGDGFGTGAAKCLCGAEGLDTAVKDGDCDDDDPGANPDATEACDLKDDDCDGETDEEQAQGCVEYFRDDDGDGYGFALDSRCLCAPAAPYDADQYGDCDQADAAVHPFATEYCNLKDDDCDGNTDEQDAVGCFTLYRDEDLDGFGVTGDGRCLCNTDAPYSVLIKGDCDDADQAVFPGATEVCNGKDDDCDDDVDEAGAIGCAVYYLDQDRDGFGPTYLSTCTCAPEAPWDATSSGDCRDGDDTIHPGAVETCDLIDNDCDGDTDEEAGPAPCDAYPTYQAFYLDADHDGYWGVADARCLCAAEGNHTSQTGGDCDDADFTVNPGALETCSNLKDDDCNGETDEAGCQGCNNYYLDVDGDSWGVSNDVKCLDAPAGDYRAAKGGDCNDLDAGVHPDAVEACNGKDDDCDGATDEKDAAGCKDYSYDGDQDGWGENGGPTRCLCAPEPPWSALVQGDCIDINKAVNPGAIESCNGMDDDCDGVTDDEGSDGCVVYLLDQDHDGFGSQADSRCLCSPEGEYNASVGGDCDDSDNTINPNAVETCDGRDEDCDGITDPDDTPGCDPWYFDFDGDHWGAESFKCLCSAKGYYRAQVPGDCDDLDSQVRPDGLEKCDGKDNDCDGITDPDGIEGCQGFYLDLDHDSWGVGDPWCLCGPRGDHTAVQSGDCDDQSGQIYPGATEICDGQDNDCDGVADNGQPVGEACDGPDGDLCENGTWTCKDDGSGVECVNEQQTDIEEQCNGLDDDCDGVTDNGDPAVMCGFAAGGVSTCEGGGCVLECDEGFLDVNHDPTDGCECAVKYEDASGATCAQARDLGVLSDAKGGVLLTVSGQILPDGDEDWYMFTGEDSPDAGTLTNPGSDRFHIRVRFVQPVVGGMRINVYRGSCVAAVQCDGGASEATEYQWYANFLDQTGDVGEAQCLTEPGPRLWDCCRTGQCDGGATTEDACCGGTDNANTTQCSDPGKDLRHCGDDGSLYFIRVFRASGVTNTCQEADYTIEVSNGIY